jgi:tripartite-type tricarboxylate transporter receptor subunit TctC
MTPVMSLAETPFVVLTNPSVPAKNIKELVAYIKSDPGKVRYGASGVGSSGHLRGEQFALATNTKMTFIPFKDGGSTLLGLVRNDINIAFDTLPGSMPLIKDGKLKLLAVSTDKRWPSAPDTPTMKEEGFPGMASQWIGAFVPAKTPPAVIKKLEDAMGKALADPDIKSQYAKMSFAVMGDGAAETAKVVKEETEGWCKTIKAAGIKIEN